jgi:hypothetical protein
VAARGERGGLAVVNANGYNLYLADNKNQNLPHIQAKYAEFEALISIGDGEILAG